MKYTKYFVIVFICFIMLVFIDVKAITVDGVSSFSVSSNYYNKINLSFDCNDCDGFRIYRFNSSKGSYYALGNTTLNTYNDSNLEFNKRYYYKVKAYKVVNGIKYYSNYSSVKSVVTKLSKGVISSVKVRNLSSLGIYYNKVDNATLYEVYRSTSLNGTYYLRSRTSKLYYYDSNSYNKNYYYKVRAYKVLNGVRVYSDFSDVYTKKIIVDTPIVSVYRYNYNTVKISFDKVVGATRYQIYRYNDIKELYEYIGYTTNSYYLSSNLTSGKEYKFKVRAYGVVNSSRVYSSYSAEKSITPRPSTPSITLDGGFGNSSVKVSISKISGVSKYEVYRLNSLNEYELVGETSDLSYVDSNLTLGDTYSYKVRGYVLVNNEKVYSNYSGVSSVRVIPKATTISFVSNNSSYDTQVIKFNYVDNATKYAIYRKVKGGSYQLIETVEGNELDSLRTTHQYHVSNLKFNTTYYYKVIVYKNGVLSDSSNVIYKTTRLNTVTNNHTQLIKNNSISVTWDAINGAGAYAVYYSNSRNGTYKLLVRTSKDYYLHSGLATGKYYYYKVRAYKIVNGKRTYGYYSSVSYQYIRSLSSYKTYTKNKLYNYFDNNKYTCTSSKCYLKDIDDDIVSTTTWDISNSKFVMENVSTVKGIKMIFTTTYYYKSNTTYTTYVYNGVKFTYKYNRNTGVETVKSYDYNNNIEIFNTMTTIEELNCTLFDGILYNLGISVSGL